MAKKEEKINKATYNDETGYLREALKSIITDGYIYVMDRDEEYVYFEHEVYNDKYISTTYRMKYSIDGVNVSLEEGSMEEVKRETQYTVVKEYVESVGDQVMKALTSFFKKDEKEVDIPVIKQFQEEQMIAVEPLYALPDTPDGHGEAMSFETIVGLVDSANEAINKGKLSGGLFHQQNTEDIEILETWVNKCECTIGETIVEEGQPIAKVKFHNPKLWEMRKSGKLGGLSIGGRGKRVPVDKGDE